MKVRVIQRNEKDYTRERKSDIRKVFRQPNASMHPFQRAREYQRALQSAKLDRLFAKPFVGSLSGHSDGVSAMMRLRRSHPSSVLSASNDGEIRRWTLTDMSCVWNIPVAHAGWIRAISDTHEDGRFCSMSDTDKSIKLWPFELPAGVQGADVEPLAVITGRETYRHMDHSWRSPYVAAGSSRVEVYDWNRPNDILQTLQWTGATSSMNSTGESLLHVQWNPVETNILSSCASDRAIVLYDIKSGKPIRRLVLEQRSNALKWNPMEAYHFTVANEDHNLYTFDMRKMQSALNVHKDHVSAVLDLDYSPTGREFVTGSYDRTVRIFDINGGHSRDVYHTRRMQRLFCVLYSSDSRFVMSGSDDMNVRIWKSKASESLKHLLPREKEKLQNATALKEKFKNVSEVRRISRQRHLPKAVYKAKYIKNEIKKAEQRKDHRRRVNQRRSIGSKKPIAERKRHILREDE